MTKNILVIYKAEIVNKITKIRIRRKNNKINKFTHASWGAAGGRKGVCVCVCLPASPAHHVPRLAPHGSTGEWGSPGAQRDSFKTGAAERRELCLGLTRVQPSASLPHPPVMLACRPHPRPHPHLLPHTLVMLCH